ncbi:LLM class F420-dependent oxidoreductase [Nocardioides immobilis]|uniref:LLM class F420-dependent oxidoreductase n=1 Tax=Nocardioides immobilis TaxID=2049295 RepID=A0A417Y0X6_9ACTN|nr:LLM class F420-dependent oxidoreductase [Nocardioides immobilis]RHW26255.1 LLM class F420-dependent oxidoreductase [Nocardioides immobilis]
MRLGYFGGNVGGMASPQAVDVARFAESLGYASIWAGEHVVLPKPRREKPPLDPDWPMADPMIQLAYLAAGTQHIRLSTGVVVATQHQPVRLAKQAATLDVLSGGRFMMGLGLGYLDLEFEVLGLPATQKRARFRECVGAMRALWTEDSPVFDGEFVSFSGVDAHPKPSTPGGPPLIMGGYADAGLDDAAKYGSGWYGFGLTPDDTREVVDRITTRLEAEDRDPRMFEIFMTPRARLDGALIKEYEQAGVTELVVSAEALDIDGIKRRLELNSPEAHGVEPAGVGTRYAWEV